MTAELEYSFLGTEFALRINEEIMNRAVRVKVAVKDKIRRIFDNKVVSLSSDEPAVEPVVETSVEPEQVETGIHTLIDLSEENLRALNDKLNAMQKQEKVPYTIKRAVLFTNGLVSKIVGVTGKWFEGMPVVESKVSEPEVQVEVPNVELKNHLGGEVVPGTWDDIPEKVETPVVSVAPEISNEQPVVETPVEEGVVSPMDSVDMASSEEPMVPNFVPDFGELPSEVEVPAVELSEENKMDDEAQSFEFVPEPKAIAEVEQEEYVPEPTMVTETEVPSEEPTVETSFEETQNERAAEVEVEVPQVESVQSEEEQEVPVSQEVSEEPKEVKMSIEDKIAELLNRKREMHQEEPEIEVTQVSEAEVDEEADKKMVSDKPEITQASVIARLQRINNTMKEKDATIRTLTAKNETAKEEVAQAKEKISGYEAVVEDLTVKNNSLTKENERLSAKVQEAETASQSVISKLEAQLAELTQARAEEKETSRKAFVELKEKHANEMADMREKHAIELKNANDKADRQIQAMYQSLSEVLPELVEEYDNGRGMAA